MPFSMTLYSNSLQHLLAELERVDLWLSKSIERARRLKGTGNAFEGICITDAEVDSLLAEPTGLPRWAAALGQPPDVVRSFTELALEIAEKAEASARAGVRLRLVELARYASLTRIDVDILLVCLAPEIDLRHERIFAYLQDDVTRRRPTVDLLLNLLCISLGEKIEMRSRFFESAPLLRHRILDAFDDPSDPRPALLGKRLRVNERIARYLLDSDEIDPTLTPFARLLPPVAPAGVNGASLVKLLSFAAEHLEEGVVIHVKGPRGVGKKTWSAKLAQSLGLGLLLIDGEKLLAAKDINVELVVRLAVREAALQGSALYWHGFDGLLADERKLLRSTLVQALQERDGLAFLAGDTPWDPGSALAPRAFASVELPRPDYAERHRIWIEALDGDLPEPIAAELTAIAGKFRFTTGEIRAAVISARDRARARGAGSSGVELDDLHAACRAQSGRELGDMARKIPPRHGFGDIVLPPDPLAQLREICDQVRYRHRVLGAWGFNDKLTLGRGTTALFSGPSGTGKTMAAAILAKELGLDLYKIDLSNVVNKYIGETEKNLERVFTAAETSNAILFFDEADALFGKRAEVKDAHDRYANIETGYLLQRMEEYEGVAILATNLRRNMDDAFVRRLSFAIHFPFPEAEERLRIWQQVWPATAPLAEGLDLPFLAKTFHFTGGNIKNVALAAAFLAAGAGQVSMAHVVQATRRELQKLGKSSVAAEFGAYSSLLDG
jgi:MoxR-like ATPase